MDYKIHHLRDWLENRPLISIHGLEKKAKLGKDTVYHFVKKRRGLPNKHYETLAQILYSYGFTEMDSE